MSTSGELKSSPRYDRIVATSRQIAWDLGHRYVRCRASVPCHRGDPDAVPTQVLSRFVDPAQVGAAVRDLITSDDLGGRRSDLP